MIADNGIVISNIFHMLAYAFRGLREPLYKRVETEPFEHLEDLLAAILLAGVKRQIKQGLHRGYVFQDDDIRTVRGRILLGRTLAHRANGRLEIGCHFDELTHDTLFNRILKQTMQVLMRDARVTPAHRRELCRALSAFGRVGEIDLRGVHWSALQLGRQTQSYELLLNICRMVYLHQLQTEDPGSLKLKQFDDVGVERIYERFLLGYFRAHHPQLRAAAPHIAWDIADDCDVPEHLPTMKSDVVLTGDKKVLVIDAKFYGQTMQRHFNKSTYHSANLYQIFTYVRNLQAAMPDVRVSGMLLYAKTNEAVTPDAKFRINGNDFSVRTLNLDCEFSEIRNSLDEIAMAIDTAA